MTDSFVPDEGDYFTIDATPLHEATNEYSSASKLGQSARIAKQSYFIPVGSGSRSLSRNARSSGENKRPLSANNSRYNRSYYESRNIMKSSLLKENQSVQILHDENTRATATCFAEKLSKNQRRAESTEPTSRMTASMSTLSTSNVMNETVRMMERVSKKREERNQVHGLNSKVYQAAASSSLKRKEMEKQVAALESRIQRLKQEEREVTRRIMKTNEKTEKTLQIKMRKQEELEAKRQLQAMREKELQKKQEKILNERKNNRASVRQAVLNNQRAKHNTVLDVKAENYQQKLIKEDINRKQAAKYQSIKSKINNLHEELKTRKFGKEINNMQTSTFKNMINIDNDAIECEELSKRYQELTNMEQAMVENLGRTYDLHHHKIVQLEKLFTMKVEPTGGTGTGTRTGKNILENL